MLPDLFLLVPGLLRGIPQNSSRLFFSVIKMRYSEELLIPESGIGTLFDLEMALRDVRRVPSSSPAQPHAKRFY